MVQRFLPIALLALVVGACGSVQETVTDLAGQGFKDFVDYGGNGDDGNLVVNSTNGEGNPAFTDDTRTYLTSDAATGSTSLTVNSTTGFSAGQEILVIQMLGTGAGVYQTAKILSVGSGTLELATALEANYTGYVAGTSVAQIIRIPNYRNVTVLSGGYLTVHAWDGQTGGVMYFRSNSDVWVKKQANTVISVAGKGYRGGAQGTKGEGSGGGDPSEGGVNVTGADPNSLLMGGGGGGGNFSGTGGNGGGFMTIKAEGKVIVDGQLIADGGDADTGSDAGGGAGGGIALLANQITSSEGCNVSSAGGTLSGAPEGAASAGGSGRIMLFYRDSVNCTDAAPAEAVTRAMFTVQ